MFCCKIEQGEVNRVCKEFGKELYYNMEAERWMRTTECKKRELTCSENKSVQQK